MAFKDQFIPFTSCFSHLMCAHLDFRFATPPDPTVREAQARSVNDFFVSYRHHESEDYSRGLVSELEVLGYRVFFASAVPQLSSMDETQILTTLRRPLHSSSVLTIIGSSEAIGGEWVRWESETFDEGHWGRQAPIIISQNGHDSDVLQNLRNYHTSAAIVYKEDKGAWESQRPSAATILCMILVREFYRVELEFWHQCMHLPAEDRPRAYLQAVFDDEVCRLIMHALHYRDRDDSLAHLRSRLLREARQRGSTI